MESDFDFDADEPGPTGRKFRVVKPTERISTHSELFVFFYGKWYRSFFYRRNGKKDAETTSD